MGDSVCYNPHKCNLELAEDDVVPFVHLKVHKWYKKRVAALITPVFFLLLTTKRAGEKTY